MIRIALIGEHESSSVTHEATERSIRHSAEQLGAEVSAEWISTAALAPNRAAEYDGLWFTPGRYDQWPRAIEAAREAREMGIPAFGTCGGFQLFALELARHLLGITDGNHEELDPDSSTVVISRLACSLRGRRMLITLGAGTLVRSLYGTDTATEEYFCQFGINPQYVGSFSTPPIRIAGSDDEGEVRVLEVAGHPFFLGTLFVPQVRSTPEAPHSLITGFLSAAADRRASSTGAN